MSGKLDKKGIKSAKEHLKEKCEFGSRDKNDI